MTLQKKQSNKDSKTIKALRSIIIGDVGSGKTAVSICILATYLKSQSAAIGAIMVPTSALAKQHYSTLLEILNQELDSWSIIHYSQGEYYLNNQKFTKAKLFKQEFKSHQIWIGTQALLFLEDLNLDMVIVDEQHRFGVKQRQKINNSKSTHFISLSATPIPRTLALSIYSDLDVHTLESFRTKNIQTRIIAKQDWFEKTKPLIQETLTQGQKVYVLCPQVEDNQETEIISTNTAFKILDKSFEGVLKVHGKEKTKLDILKRFKEDSNARILVSTSVIEVGIDVSSASLMIILDAQQFGLAALHQIRGRIGRNNYPNNLCILVSPYFTKRLSILENTQDGFLISKEDMKIRGQGAVYGLQQSGFDPEIETILGLEEKVKEKLLGDVESLDFRTLEQNLPRLKNYLQKTTQEIWDE